MARVQPARRKSLREKAADWLADVFGIEGGGGPETTTDEDGFTWQDVDSSNVEAVAYNPFTGQMRIRFGVDKPSSTYEYDGVSPAEFQELLEADSKGSHVWHVVRGGGADNVYAYRKIG